MYLTPNEIREARYNSLQLFSAVSNSCLDAGNRLSELFIDNTRQALAWSGELFAKTNYGFGLDGAETLTALLPSHPLSNSSRVQNEFFGILDETYKLLVQAAEAQIRICDQLLYYAIEHGSRTSPWEGEMALNTLRATVQSAEMALHGMTDTAISSAEIAEQQVKQVAESLTPSRPVKKAAAPRKRSLAN
jgi:hypothetical protein